MADLYPGPVAAPACYAGNILGAWVCGDETTLRQELAKGLDYCSAPHALPLEEENLELLKAVVARLNACPAVLNAEPADPMVRVCISLLMHLAGQFDWSESSDGSPAAGQDQT
ncbi:MAG: hypothetical protein ABSH40_22865 [Bryobacteraceae bacterium]|jgi:hypothetical protein